MYNKKELGLGLGLGLGRKEGMDRVRKEGRYGLCAEKHHRSCS